MQSRKTLPQLFFPIALESLFMILTGTVDTMMLASVSDAAVGAVGTANSYLSIFIIMLAVISSGLVSVVTQYIGAERRTAAGQTLHLGLCFNALLGILLSLVLYFGSGLILRYGGIAPLLLDDASIYLKIVGGTWFFGIHLGLNAVGAYLAMALDECVRAVFLRCRWQSEKWQSKGILYRKETTA